MKNKEIIILLDYRSQFYSSTRYKGASLDLEKLKLYFKKKGFNLIKKHFYEINFRKNNYKDLLILYQSSEDPSLFYKDYIEDILLTLKLHGAILIPDFQFFRAHHNKVFMEFLRDFYDIIEIKNILSKSFGSYEDYQKNIKLFTENDHVFKTSSTSRSNGVKLLNSFKQKNKIPLKMSRSFTCQNFIWLFKKILFGEKYLPQSNHRKKFVIQNFVSNLDGDYRVLIYGEKYYVLYRKKRNNYFTASGSGKLDFNIEIPNGLLDFSKNIFNKFNVPFISIDIGYKDKNFFVFEFQFICFGQYAIEKSNFYYHFNNVNKIWEKIYENPNVEQEFVCAVVNYINKLY